MAKIHLQFETDNGCDVESTAALLQQKLSQLPEVERAKASPGDMRLGVTEAAVIIAGVVTLLRDTGDLIDAVRKLVPKVKALMSEIGAIKAVYVEAGMRRVPINELHTLSDAEVKKIVE